MVEAHSRWKMATFMKENGEMDVVMVKASTRGQQVIYILARGIAIDDMAMESLFGAMEDSMMESTIWENEKVRP
jgi:hypothetical protein